MKEELSLNIKRQLFRDFLLFSLNDSSISSPILSKLSLDQQKRALEFLSTKKMEHLFIPFCRANSIILNKDIESVASSLTNDYYLTTFMQQEIALYQIQEILDKNMIRYIFLKGAETRNLFKKPIYRRSNDIDILVDKENIDKVSTLLTSSMNGEFETKGMVHDSFFLLNKQVRVELHRSLFTDTSNECLGGLFSAPFSNTYVDEKHPYRYHLNLSFNYAYIIGHIYKHCRSDGFYLPSLMDISILKSLPTFNRDEVNNLLKISKTDKFESLLTSLLNKYKSNEELTSLESKLEDFMMLHYEEAYLHASKYKSKTKGNYIKNRLFLDQKSMAYLFPILEKHPWMTPFFHPVRWIKALFRGKLSEANKRLTGFSSLDEEEIKNTNELFNEIGLLE